MATNEQQASNDWGTADLISLLSPHLPDNLKSQAIDCARQLNDPGARATALSSLSTGVTEIDAFILIEDALATARSIENQWLKLRTLAEIANTLPKNRKEEVLAEALSYVEEIPGEWHRKRALSLLANRLPDDLADQAILLARKLQNEPARVQTLFKFVRRLSERERVTLLKDVRLIEDEATRAAGLISLLKYLPLEAKSDLLNYAKGLREAEQRSQVFAALAQHFTDRQVEFQEEALKMGRSITEPYGRFWALFDLLPSLPDTVRGKVIEEVFDTIKMIEDEQWRVFALFNLASLLPEEQRPAVMQEALETARQIEDTYRRITALLTIIESLPDDLRPDIIQESMIVLTE